jgi:hypothetical protein
LDAQQLQDMLRARFGWRVGPHTAAYILSQLNAPKAKSIKVFVNDARTGMPLHETLNPDQVVAPP